MNGNEFFQTNKKHQNKKYENKNNTKKHKRFFQTKF
jgi:hypothetical protein